MGQIFANDACRRSCCAGIRIIVECITNSIPPVLERHPAFLPRPVNHTISGLVEK
jgi:hypothetical protein